MATTQELTLKVTVDAEQLNSLSAQFYKLSKSAENAAKAIDSRGQIPYNRIMAIVECWECKGQVSDAADTCPHCGATTRNPSAEQAQFHASGAPLQASLEPSQPTPQATDAPPPPGYYSHAPKKIDIKKGMVCRNCGYVGTVSEFLLQSKDQSFNQIASALAIVFACLIVYVIFDFVIFAYIALICFLLSILGSFHNYSDRYKKCPHCETEHPLKVDSPKGKELLEKNKNKSVIGIDAAIQNSLKYKKHSRT